MLVLALDTTSRSGSLALVREGAVLQVSVGDPSLTHGRRLPGDIIDLLARGGVTIHDVDLFGVVVGPGSFTGLRIGIATAQGLALAGGRGVVGVSAFDALNLAAASPGPAITGRQTPASAVATWIDAQRGEVFAALYRGETIVAGPTVEPPEVTLRQLADLAEKTPITFVGTGAELYSDLVSSTLQGRARIIAPAPLLAPAAGRLAEMRARAGGGSSPESLQPLYVRRPDAEIARDRKRG